MLRIDDRIGSKELAPLFKPFGIQPLVCRLEFGDLDWVGKGPHGDAMVVVERKRIEDLIQSVQSGRLSGHQLPGMADNYDYCYLIVEGVWRPGKDGMIEIANGSWRSTGTHYSAMDGYLANLELRCGVIYRRTSTPQETVFVVKDLYLGWTDKDWSEHKSHERVYAPCDPAGGRRLTWKPRKVSLCEKVAMQLPGVDSKARWVAKKFGSVWGMATAGVEDWAEVEWKGKEGKVRRVGKAAADKLVKAIRGEE